MLRIVFGAARHPASPLDRLPCDDVIRILVILIVGIHGHDGIYLQPPEQKDQPRPQLNDGAIVHPVIAIVKGIDLLAAQRFAGLLIIRLVLHHSVSQRSTGRLVIGQADQVRGVAFVNELRHGSTCKQRDVVGMGLDRRQDLPW